MATKLFNKSAFKKLGSSMKNRNVRLIFTVFALLFASALMAQSLEDINIGGAGGQPEVNIKFAAQVRFQRYVVDASKQSVQIYFQVTGENSTGAIEDTRTIAASAELPGFMARYATPQGGVAVPRRLDLTFDAPVEIEFVGQGSDIRSLVLRLHAGQPNLAQAPIAGATPTVSNATEPAGMLKDAQAALARQDYDGAITLLNQVLNLPPNAASQEAQELIGQVREALGGTDRARAEYTLYLKLYPEGAGAERVRARLAALNLPQAEAVAGGATARPREVITWGSVSSSYYGGNSRIRTDNIIITPATNATTIDSNTFSQLDQSSLVTNLDANVRVRSGDWDNRFVLRDLFGLNFLPGQGSENRLNTAYADFKYQPQQLSARIGRQTANSSSVLGRFDGATLGWELTPKFRIGAIGGRPSQAGFGNTPNFIALTSDWETPLEGFGVGFFAVRQTVDGLTDRQAVGTELRYFKDATSVFSLLDYDLKFSEINVVSVQGSYQWESGGVVNFLYDYRRTPTLQMANALLGVNPIPNPDGTFLIPTLSGLLQTQTQDQIQRQALGLTPISKVLLIGTTQPVSSKWQIGAEFRLSSLTGTEAFGDFPAQPSTGNVYTGTLTAIGTGFLTETGVVTLTASRLSADAYDAWLMAVNSRFRFGNRWSLEPAVRWYRQNNVANVSAPNGSSLTRIAPTIRGIFQIRESFSLEGEISAERSRFDSTALVDTSNILFYYLGFRWDF